jgi:MFS family permease
MSEPIAEPIPPNPGAHSPLPPEKLERSLRINMLAASFGMVWMTVPLGMPLPLLMDTIGASGLQLGLLAGSWQFAMIAQVVSALATESCDRRKPFWAVISIIHRLLWIVPALVPIVLRGRRELWPAVIIAALATSNILGQAGTGLWQGWMADLIPPARAGSFWGRRHQVLSYGSTIAALAFGAILDHWTSPAHPLLGFQIVFTIAGLVGVADIVTHLAVYEPPPQRHAQDKTILQRLAVPLRRPGFLRLTLAMAVWTGAAAMLGYTLGLPGFFGISYLKEHFGTTYSEAALVYVASAVGGSLWAPTAGRMVDRYGGRKVALWLVFGSPLVMLIWLGASGARWHLPLFSSPVPQAVVLMSAASLLLGGLYAGVWVCQVRLTQAFTTTAGRTVAMGLHWSIVGLLGSLGPLIAGWVKDHVHERMWGMNYFQLLVVLHLVLAWGLAFPLVYGIKRESRAQ